MREHFVLPEGKVLIAFSGGRTSAFMLHAILEANGGLPEDRVAVIFTNTGRERAETLDFVQEVGRRWSVPITWLEYRYDNGPRAVPVCRASASLNGEPFEALILRKQALPNSQQRWCTEELKVKTARRWLVMQGWRRWTKATGIRADETHRLNPAKQPRETIWHPLAAAGIRREDVAEFWKGQPFDLRLPIFKGRTIGGNCRGCFLKSEAAIADDLMMEPEDRWLDRMEMERGRTFKKEWSIASLRALLERQPMLMLEGHGLLCQAKEGECT